MYLDKQLSCTSGKFLWKTSGTKCNFQQSCTLQACNFIENKRFSQVVWKNFQHRHIIHQGFMQTSYSTYMNIFQKLLRKFLEKHRNEGSFFVSSQKLSQERPPLQTFQWAGMSKTIIQTIISKNLFQQLFLLFLLALRNFESYI